MKRTVDAMQELKRYVAGYPTQNSAARALGISKGFLSLQLSGKVGIPESVLRKLGLTRVQTIERLKESA